jgi:hypothetical protein
MKTIILALALFAMLVLSAQAQDTHEIITVSNTVATISASAYTSPSITKAFCTLETAQIRFWLDGTSPTTSEGHIMEIGQYMVFSKPEMIKFRAIRTGGTSGVLSCTYY